MTSAPKKILPGLLWGVALAVVGAAAWAGWLGWDQEYDRHPDGSVSGPYQAWQVIGLALTLLAAVVLGASRRHYVAAVLGTTTGLSTAVWTDWSDDGSGLWIIGFAMITIGALGVGPLVCLATATVMRNRNRNRDRNRDRPLPRPNRPRPTGA